MTNEASEYSLAAKDNVQYITTHLKKAKLYSLEKCSIIQTCVKVWAL